MSQKPESLRGRSTSQPTTHDCNWVESSLSCLVSGQSLAIFRMVFGMIMLLEAVCLFLPSQSTAGQVMMDVYYTGENLGMAFPYPGFSWLPWLPSWGFVVLICLMGIASLSMALGYRYRIAAFLVFMSWGYLYAVESTRTYWMSYYYLELLISFLMVWLPAHQCWSLDASQKKTQDSNLVPFWAIAILRFQLVVMYFYAGCAKVNTDWLLDAQPVTYFLSFPHVSERLQTFFPWISDVSLKTQLTSTWLAYGLSWSGALFDLIAGPLLLMRRTRYLGLALMAVFHGINHTLLFDDLLWFPLLGLSSALIFLEPTWPSRFFQWCKKPHFKRPHTRWVIGGAIFFPLIGCLLGWKAKADIIKDGAVVISKTLKGGLLAWCLIQTLFPLRHLLIAGDHRITFEGLSWSWRLKAEVYRASPCQVTIDDPKVLNTSQEHSARIDGTAWKGVSHFYRFMEPTSVDWMQLPVIFILQEPMMGQRVIYNPSGSKEPMPEGLDAVSKKIRNLWNELYGRASSSAHPLTSLSRILEDYTTLLEKKGHKVRDTHHGLELLYQFNGLRGDGSMMPYLRRIQPFGLSGGLPAQVPLFLIEDEKLTIQQSDGLVMIEPNAWKNSPATGINGQSEYVRGTENGWLTLHLANPHPSERQALPQACLIQKWVDGQWQSPKIDWDYSRDLSVSKCMHMSTSPFHLKTYATHLADQWESLHGYRPKVQARSFVSVNFRPQKSNIDPSADLAASKVSHWSHNDWIDLTSLSRIPPENRHTRRP